MLYHFLDWFDWPYEDFPIGEVGSIQRQCSGHSESWSEESNMRNSIDDHSRLGRLVWFVRLWECGHLTEGLILLQLFVNVLDQCANSSIICQWSIRLCLN